MITWLQTFFLKHNKWLFGSLLIVIIVTFVLTIGPQSIFDGGGTQKRKTMRYYGYDLSSEADQQTLVRTAELSSYLHPELQIRRDQLTDYAYMRATALGLADQLGIPRPGRDDLSRFLESLEAFKNPETNEFSPEAYRSLVDAIEGSGRFPQGFLGMVLREDYRIYQVRNALSGPDYILPFETRIAFADSLTEYDVTLAHLSYDTFSPEIDLSEPALEQFFRQNPARYEIPETLLVTALQFKGAAYVDEVAEPTEGELEAYFAANKYLFQPRDSGEENPPEVLLSDVREDVVAEWKRVQARRLAAKKSEQFSVRLWQDSVALESPEYKSLVEDFSVVSVDIPPYSRELPLQTPAASAQLLQSMWVYANNPSRYFSDIGQAPDGAVLLVKRTLNEARMPEFSEVRETVVEDYRREEKRRLFAEKGAELRQAIQADLADTSFKERAESMGLEVEEVDPFIGNNLPPELRVASLWEQTQYMDAGEISPMVIQQDRGTFSYMERKEVPEIDTNSAEYREYISMRGAALSQSMGWARLREITDTGLATLFDSDR